MDFSAVFTELGTLGSSEPTRMPRKLKCLSVAAIKFKLIGEMHITRSRSVPVAGEEGYFWTLSWLPCASSGQVCSVWARRGLLFESALVVSGPVGGWQGSRTGSDEG